MPLIDLLFNKDKSLRAKGRHYYDVEMGEDFYEHLENNKPTHISYQYSSNGVEMYKMQNTMRLIYSGLLAKNGAQDVYAVMSFGDNNHWEDIKYYPMHPTGNQSYELLFPIHEMTSINIAFKDGADHWDNNSGMNYTFNTHHIV